MVPELNSHHSGDQGPTVVRWRCGCETGNTPPPQPQADHTRTTVEYGGGEDHDGGDKLDVGRFYSVEQVSTTATPSSRGNGLRRLPRAAAAGGVHKGGIGPESPAAGSAAQAAPYGVRCGLSTGACVRNTARAASRACSLRACSLQPVEPMLGSALLVSDLDRECKINFVTVA